MTVHITRSKNIENVFLGTAEDAPKDGAGTVQPTIDKVTQRWHDRGGLWIQYSGRSWMRI